MNKANIALLLTAVFLAFSPPVAEAHAHCNLVWSWSGTTCDFVKIQIMSQIAKWSKNDKDACGSTEKCGYKLVSNSTNEIKATHTTPVKKYVDDLTMTFSGTTTSCTVTAKSSSELWYAMLDYGTNYCNLHNLITGAGLDKAYNFKEQVPSDDCTQYSSANCDKY